MTYKHILNKIFKEILQWQQKKQAIKARKKS
jgi:hypothetical protein